MIPAGATLLPVAARAALALLVAFLSLRGAVSVWQQFNAAGATAAPPAASAAAVRAPVPDPVPVATPLVAAPAASEVSAGPAPSVPARNTPGWRALESSASFVEGRAGPLVIAFIDVDCAYCAELWRRVRAPLAAGQLRMRWVPVAVVAPGGAARAAGLLRARDPASALAAYQTRADAPTPPDARSHHSDIAANNALLAALTEGRPATPLLIARDAGGAPQRVIGLPADLGAFLAAAH